MNDYASIPGKPHRRQVVWAIIGVGSGVIAVGVLAVGDLDAVSWTLVGQSMGLAALSLISMPPSRAALKLAAAALAAVAALVLAGVVVADRSVVFLTIVRAIMTVSLAGIGALSLASIWRPSLIGPPAARRSRLSAARAKTAVAVLAAIVVILAASTIGLIWYVLEAR